MWWRFKPYVSAAQRRAKAAQTVKKLTKGGRALSPVALQGKKIATTFWGQAWCDNLESYSDFSNRLPRGRSYVRNGSVLDLQIQPGCITAMVSGSDIYNIRIELAPLGQAVWTAVKTQCAGRIASLVDLLQGKLSKDVMAVVTAREQGLFPKAKQIQMKCSCPDYAYLCKHLAAVLYGVGARLDEQPELLFRLRQVDHLELIAAAGENVAAPKGATRKKTLADDSLSEIFGIELESSAQGPEASPAVAATKSAGGAKRARRSVAMQTAAPVPEPAPAPSTAIQRRTARKQAGVAVQTLAPPKPSKRPARPASARSAAAAKIAASKAKARVPKKRSSK